MTGRGAGRPLALALFGGGLIATSFLDFSLGLLAWLAFAPILVAFHGADRSRQAFVVGLVAGLATNVPAFHWLVGTIHRFGGFPLSLAILFYVILSLYSSLQFGLFALGVRRLGHGPLALAAPILWIALEFLYPNLFPWRLASSQLEQWVLLQVGDVTGPFGLSFVMVWLGAGLALAYDRGLRAAVSPLAGVGLALLAIVAYGVLRGAAIERVMTSAPTVRVGIVQGNLSIAEKGNVQFLESNLAAYRTLSLAIADRSDVVIWPETVIGVPLPRDLASLPLGARAALGLRGPLISGALTFGGPPERPIFYNSIVLFSGDGRILGFSDKQILMPFGEYIPLAGLFPGLKQLSPQTGDFQAGRRIVPLDVPGAGRFAPLNCYEDLREAIARNAVGEDGAEILFAVANDAWFGRGAAPFQHEALALWRAIENRRTLIRVTNTGVTDVIEPTGRIALRFPIFEPRGDVAEVRKLGLTSVYTRVGPAFAWLVTLLAVIALVMKPRP